MNIDLTTLRSLLFVPATKLNKITQVSESGTDLIIIDLEDSVNVAEKDSMRQAVTTFFEEWEPEKFGAAIGVRINSVRSIDGVLDFLSIMDTPNLPDALMLPKVDSVMEIDLVADWMEDIDILVPVIPIFETLAVWDEIDEIMAHDLVPCGVFGGIDLAAELGSDRSWESMQLYRNLLLRAARRSDKACLDMPWFDLNDEAGLRKETLRLQSMGYDGRVAIHPAQVAVIHECFRPDDKAVADARAMIDAFEQSSTGVVTFKGKVVEKPVLMHAYKLIERAQRFT
ncbi:MAG: CoA ester lyase [Balneolales bacterium]|nr:CoA ester lyase [Balneolales bacterium]